MIKYFLYITLSLLAFTLSSAKNVNIEEDIKLGFVCELEKKILKNSEYNYKTFLAKDSDNKNLDQFEIEARQPETLLINGLSLFLSNTSKFDVKVANKDVVLFKAFDEEMNYSESGIIDRLSGELVHEITIGLKSVNLEKEIYFYLCR
tara:strand:+ start:137 stop:580 length:444 start_codon:yes stop_codon:yes gene_type:complete